MFYVYFHISSCQTKEKNAIIYDECADDLSDVNIRFVVWEVDIASPKNE